MQVSRRRASVLAATALGAATLLAGAWGAGARSGGPAGVHGHVDFWNYDPQSGERTADWSPGVAPQDLAWLYGPTAAVADTSAREAPPDFWNYDPLTGKKVADSSPGVATDELATLWSGSGLARG